MELLNIGSFAIGRLDGGSLDDGNTIGTNAMTGSHFLVHLLDSAVQGGVTVLFVCVMGTCARIVPHPDAEVFDGGGVLLEDLIHRQNLTIGLLHTSKLLQEVPASGKATRLTMCVFEIQQQRRRRQVL